MEAEAPELLSLKMLNGKTDGFTGSNAPKRFLIFQDAPSFATHRHVYRERQFLYPGTSPEMVPDLTFCLGLIFSNALFLALGHSTSCRFPSGLLPKYHNTNKDSIKAPTTPSHNMPSGKRNCFHVPES
jgi:hypothetical protein